MLREAQRTQRPEHENITNDIKQTHNTTTDDKLTHAEHLTVCLNMQPNQKCLSVSLKVHQL